MKRLLLVLLLSLTVVLALVGCDDASPILTGTPTPAATPTPLPDAFTAEITAAPVPTNLLGHEIQASDHYWQYLSFGELRVYEYEDGTFLDGLCVNAYPAPLVGVVKIVYYAESGKVCGVGTIHNALGVTRLETGTNAIYAEINTDIDVTGMEFALEVATPFLPVATDATGG